MNWPASVLTNPTQLHKWNKAMRQICKLCMYPTAYSILTMTDKTPSSAECLTCQGQNACNMIPFFKENDWTFGNKLAALDTLHPIRAYISFKQAFRYGFAFPAQSASASTTVLWESVYVAGESLRPKEVGGKGELISINYGHRVNCSGRREPSYKFLQKLWIQNPRGLVPERTKLNRQRQLSPNGERDTIKYTLLVACPNPLCQVSAPIFQLLWVLAANCSQLPLLTKEMPPNDDSHLTQEGTLIQEIALNQWGTERGVHRQREQLWGMIHAQETPTPMARLNLRPHPWLALPHPTSLIPL